MKNYIPFKIYILILWIGFECVSTLYAGHFVPVWSGNPYNPMTIIVTKSKLDGVALVAGDEIGVFDGVYCVGAGMLTQSSDPAVISTYLYLTCSKDDEQEAGIDGYSPGHQIIYKIWKQSTNSETGFISPSYPFAPLYVFDHFSFNETAIVQIMASTIPENRILQNHTISGTQCFNALQTITVAGTGTAFLVQSGGSATMIAGQNILYFPTTIVQSGGYMLGYIAPAGPFCIAPSIPAVAKVEEEIPRSIVKSLFKVYPNPTTGNFFLELASDAYRVNVDLYGMWGEKVLSALLNGERKHEFSLSDRPVGVYFIRVISGDNAETLKIIKQ